MDSEADLGMGNIMELGLLDIWTSREMSELRESFYSNRPVNSCIGCGQYEGLDLFRTPAGRKMARMILARYKPDLKKPDAQLRIMINNIEVI